jgi:hypothetical protein
VTAFVETVTRVGSQDFLPPAERIAVFDNEGTLWSGHPVLEMLKDDWKSFHPGQ